MPATLEGPFRNTLRPGKPSLCAVQYYMYHILSWPQLLHVAGWCFFGHSCRIMQPCYDSALARLHSVCGLMRHIKGHTLTFNLCHLLNFTEDYDGKIVGYVLAKM